MSTGRACDGSRGDQGGDQQHRFHYHSDEGSKQIRPTRTSLNSKHQSPQGDVYKRHPQHRKHKIIIPTRQTKHEHQIPPRPRSTQKTLRRRPKQQEISNKQRGLHHQQKRHGPNLPQQPAHTTRRQHKTSSCSLHPMRDQFIHVIQHQQQNSSQHQNHIMTTHRGRRNQD